VFTLAEFWDMACQVKDGVLPFHPFAFRVHGHHLGKAIMGYMSAQLYLSGPEFIFVKVWKNFKESSGS